MATPSEGYKNAEGKRIPGTTTIIGRFKDSGGLLYWAFEQGKLAQQGKIQKLYDKAEEAAAIGTLAHEMVEKFINGEDHVVVIKDVETEAASKALNAFQMFRDWKEQTKIEIISHYQEIKLVSEKYQYGGTPDAIGKFNGKLILLDWKTSNSVYQDYLLQLAAYKLLWEENHPDEPIDGGFYLCRFSKDFPDFSVHYFEELEVATKQFILLRECYQNDSELKKRVK